MQAPEVVRDARHPSGVAVDREEIEIGELGEVRRLAAGRRAGVEHAHPVTDVEQRRRQLRAGILHRDIAVAEARQLVDAPRPVEPHGGLADARGRNALGRKAREIRVDAQAPAVHAQGQRRAVVSRREDRFPAAGLRMPHAVDPPLRIPEPSGLRAPRVGFERLAPAQVVAQHCIHEPARGAVAELRAGGDRLVDDGVRGAALVAQLVERAEQQRVDGAIGDPLSGERGEQRLRRPVVAERRVRQVLHCRARGPGLRFVERGVQAGAAEHACDGPARAGEDFG